MMGGGNDFIGIDDGIVPHGKPGWSKVGAGVCKSSDCFTDNLRVSAPSRLGVTGEKADGRGRDLASLLSVFSLSVTVFGFATFWLSSSTGLSPSTYTSSVSSLLSALFSSAPFFSGLLF